MVFIIYQNSFPPHEEALTDGIDIIYHHLEAHRTTLILALTSNLDLWISMSILREWQVTHIEIRTAPSSSRAGITCPYTVLYLVRKEYPIRQTQRR